MTPQIILVGYPGSQKIVSASKYLMDKYLPMFNVIYLNYKGEINGWAEYVAGFLRYLTDDIVIVALDDYLISNYLDVDAYEAAESKICGDVVCVKLCESTEEEHKEYPITTQFCLWKREYLIWLLDQVKEPWEFEIQGSRIFYDGDKRSLLKTCIHYDAHSALSSRWEGIKLDGLSEEDIKYLKENELI